ncbi:MAG: PAS domain S-box protein, partial [Planctomycetes bacterium]|nr:PAS domain S-box protein [Planctomycetota bacterium]
PIIREIRRGEPLIADSSPQHQQSNELRDFLEFSGVAAALFVPLMSHRGELVGFVAVTSSKARAYSAAEVVLLKVFGDMVARSWERKAADASLRLTHVSIERSSDAIFWVGPSGQVEYANHAGVKMIGMSLAEIMSRPAWKFNAGRVTTHKQWDHFFEVLRKRGHLHGEDLLLLRNGVTLPVESTVDYIVVDSAEFACVSFRDITLRKQAESEQARRLELEHCFAEISRQLNNEHVLKEENLAEEIARALRASRVFVQWQDERARERTLVWRAEGVAESKFHPVSNPESFPWWQTSLDLGETLVVESLDKLPENAAREAQCFRSAGSEALMAAPLRDVLGRRVGAVVVERSSATSWYGFEIEALGILASMLASARQQSLAQNALRLQSKLIEEMNDAIIVLDTRGTIMSWNRGATRIFEHGSNEAIGQHFSILFPQEKHASLFQEVIEPILSKERHEVERKTLSKSGRSLDTFFSLSLLRDETQKPTGVACFAIDISARKRAEEHLRASQARLTAIVNSVRDAVLSFDETGWINSASASAGELFGYQTHELSGMYVSELMNAKDWEDVRRVLQELQQGKINQGSLEVQGLTRNRDVFPAQVSVVAGIAVGKRFFTMSLRDLSNLRDATNRLAQSERMNMLGSMVTGVAHQLIDILTPLRATKALFEEDSLSQRQADALRRVDTCATRAAHLVNQILAFSKRETKATQRTITASKYVSAIARQIEDAAQGQFSFEIESGAMSLLPADRLTEEQKWFVEAAKIL